MGGLIRVAVIVIIAVLLYRLVKRWLDGLPQNRAPDKIGRMVRCRYCDLHLPEQDAIRIGEAWYCSEEHRRLDHKPRS